jgi:hypothetical protein
LEQLLRKCPLLAVSRQRPNEVKKLTMGEEQARSKKAFWVLRTAFFIFEFVFITLLLLSMLLLPGAIIFGGNDNVPVALSILFGGFLFVLFYFWVRLKVIYHLEKFFNINQEKFF